MKSGLSRMLSNTDIGLPVIRANNIDNGRLNLENDIKYWYTNDPQGAKTSNYFVKRNDILVNFINSEAKMGTATIVDIDPIRQTIYTTNILNLRTNQLAYAYFIFSLTMTKNYTTYINIITKPAVNQASFTTVDFKKFTFFLPKIQEQTQIGEFFKQLDNTIVLHQRKLDKLKQLKQGYLKLIFDQKLKFLGFTDRWELCTLNSIVNRVKSYSLSRDVETNEDTGYRYIHYGDIHTKVADIINSFSNLPYIKAENYELLQQGDLVLADASEDYKGIATPAIVNIDTPYKLVSGLHTIALRPHRADSLFLYYLMNSPVFRKYGYKIGTGMKVFGISATNLLKFEGFLPAQEEQIKIGKFFKQFDDTITLERAKIEQLSKLKKAYLQKMFI